MYDSVKFLWQEGAMECPDWLSRTDSDHEFTISAESSGEIYSALTRHIAQGASLLELGSGLGPDLPALLQHCQVTASDLCEKMVLHLRHTVAMTPVLRLDAASIQTLRQFDAIFSNKVMQHLDSEQAQSSMQRQQEVVRPDGIIAHTFWVNQSTRDKPFGSKKTESKSSLIDMVAEHFEVREALSYGAFMPNDSLLVIARNSLPQPRG